MTKVRLEFEIDIADYHEVKKAMLKLVEELSNAGELNGLKIKNVKSAYRGYL